MLCSCLVLLLLSSKILFKLFYLSVLLSPYPYAIKTWSTRPLTCNTLIFGKLLQISQKRSARDCQGNPTLHDRFTFAASFLVNSLSWIMDKSNWKGYLNIQDCPGQPAQQKGQPNTWTSMVTEVKLKWPDHQINKIPNQVSQRCELRSYPDKLQSGSIKKVFSWAHITDLSRLLAIPLHA